MVGVMALCVVLLLSPGRSDLIICSHRIPKRGTILLDVIVAEGRAAAAHRPARAEVAAAAEAALEEAAARGTAEAAQAEEHTQRHHAHHRQDDQRETVQIEKLLVFVTFYYLSRMLHYQIYY